jgi:hypothetical protein
LLSDEQLELADLGSILGFAERRPAPRGSAPGGPAIRREPLPALQQVPGDPQLLAQLGERQLAAQNAGDLLLFELGGENPLAIRLTGDALSLRPIPGECETRRGSGRFSRMASPDQTGSDCA